MSKTSEELRDEATTVLERVASRIKKECENALSGNEVSDLSSLVDSYARLYEEVK